MGCGLFHIPASREATDFVARRRVVRLQYQQLADGWTEVHPTWAVDCSTFRQVARRLISWPEGGLYDCNTNSLLAGGLKSTLQDGTPHHASVGSASCPATISAHCSGVYSTSRAWEPL